MRAGVNHPGIFQIGVVTDNGETIRIEGWTLTYCQPHCPCHTPLRIHQDQDAGLLGLMQNVRCACCIPWPANELAAVVRDLATLERFRKEADPQAST